MVIVQIESAEGLANVEEIAAVPGVDVLLIGPNDLSISLGIPGEYETDMFRDAVSRIVAACQASGVAIGTLAMSGELMRPWYEMGFRFLLCNTDTNMIAEAAYRDVATIREFTN
jgi:4-hydroxy-2-oxoheptanedioate aldolase